MKKRRFNVSANSSNFRSDLILNNTAKLNKTGTWKSDLSKYRKSSNPPKFKKFESFDHLVFDLTILLVAMRQERKAEDIIDDITRECWR